MTKMRNKIIRKIFYGVLLTIIYLFVGIVATPFIYLGTHRTLIEAWREDTDWMWDMMIETFEEIDNEKR